MPTGQASRASVLTSACLRASGASPRHSANHNCRRRREESLIDRNSYDDPIFQTISDQSETPHVVSYTKKRA